MQPALRLSIVGSDLESEPIRKDGVTSPSVKLTYLILFNDKDLNQRALPPKLSPEIWLVTGCHETFGLEQTTAFARRVATGEISKDARGWYRNEVGAPVFEIAGLLSEEAARDQFKSDLGRLMNKRAVGGDVNSAFAERILNDEVSVQEILQAMDVSYQLRAIIPAKTLEQVVFHAKRFIIAERADKAGHDWREAVRQAGYGIPEDNVRTVR